MTIRNPRSTLDNQIQNLFDEILLLSSMVETATHDAVDALKRRDLRKARRTYDGDKAINTKRFEIENQVMVLISTQQPMARDARILASVFEVASELERMGDYAKGIARICLLMANQPPVKPLVDIPRMAEKAVDMLHRAIDAFINADAETAKQIPEEDDDVDVLYNQVIRELITYMIADTSTINRANFLIWAAHNLERLADRVTNICERTIYIATGLLEEIKVSDDEQDVLELNLLRENDESS
jgi:phosphate transport system protein